MSTRSNNDITLAFASGTEKRFRKTEIICRTDDSENVYLIKRGYVKEYAIDKSGSCQLLLILGPHEILPTHWGEDRKQSALFYEAISDTSVTAISRMQLLERVKTDLETSRAATELLQTTLEAYSERVNNLELSTARDRILYRILFLARRFGRKMPDNRVLIDAPTNYQYVADALNMTRETANRVFRQLIKQGIIERKGRQLVVPSINRIAGSLGITPPAIAQTPKI